MGGDEDTISRRTVLKGAGVAALAGLVAANHHNGSEQTSDELDLPAFRIPEQYSDRGWTPAKIPNGQGGQITAFPGVETLAVTRGINHVGMSLPDEEDVYGEVCEGHGDTGYVTHRFIVGHLSYGMTDHAPFPKGIKVNKAANCDVQVAGSDGTCGSTKFVVNDRVAASFPLTNRFLAMTSRRRSPSTRNLRLMESRMPAVEPTDKKICPGGN